MASSSPAELVAWRAMRLSLIFMLDIVDLSDLGGEPIDPLIISVISSASVAPISHDTRLEHAYATVEAPPPDDVRRPVSISAVARSAGLPFETVRRRIGHLVEAGLCELSAVSANETDSGFQLAEGFGLIAVT